MTPRYPDPDDRLVLEPDCRRCPELAAARERISWGVGPADADLVVVGEAPGPGAPEADRWRGGNWTGMAYTSRASGRKVRAMFEQLGHPDAYYTNAVKCFPLDPAGGNREPAAEERANCRPYLLDEIERVDPACVVATGKHATRSLLAVEGREVGRFLDLVLEPQDCPTLGVPVLPVLHPSYQEVWISRLGYTYESYRDAIGAVLSEYA
ncbi:uracil-DNA glycosylase family protein [Halomarina halobia]|uniref:Uracil-DNA glycosylase family protein n=1 Tax=Halomarina halobia TaxID=3033386 RepID=A0ABD6AAE8_9EURY|nr:uracil-DNA glycosylase [Halomarina sp. PSR21]